MALFKKHQKHPEEEAWRAPPDDLGDGEDSASHDESNWLVSYADMMTLLCGFFIMLFSMATLNEPKYDSFKAALAKQFGGHYEVPDTKNLAQFATEILQELGVSKDTIVKSDLNGVAISFESTMFFDTLSAEVKPEGRMILNRVIDRVSKYQAKVGKAYKIVVEGHTDRRPVLDGIYPTNWELSGARAAKVVRMFVDRGFAPDHLTAIGYGDTRPEYESRDPAGEWNEAAMVKNRRVVIRVIEPTADGIPDPASPAH